jgi:DNA repair ATPase RecN
VTRSGVKVKVVRLEREARVAELARMLGGAESTARKHAAEMLGGRARPIDA